MRAHSLQQNSQHHQTNTLIIDLNDYLGGVALWGAIPAIYDTKNEGYDRGIHVHARRKGSHQKVIDKTFSTVAVKYQNQVIMIHENAAIAFAMSTLLNFNMVALVCRNCGNLLLDTGLSAVLPSKIHHCTTCLTTTYTESPCIANPLIQLKTLMKDTYSIRPTQIPNRTIDLDNPRYCGGIQLWGSNSSIIWTADKLEECGTHVHAYDCNNKRVIDNTYSSVKIYGAIMNNNMVRAMQVQQAIPEVTQHLTYISCPNCHHDIFHQNRQAILPTTQQYCDNCHHQWQTKPLISNPVFRLFQSHKEKST